MNSSSIAGVQKTMQEAFERVEVPQVEAVASSGDSTLNMNSQTQSGLIRLAQFLAKREKKTEDRRLRTARGHQRYLYVRDFDDRLEPGQVFSKII